MLDDLSRELGLDEDTEKVRCDEVLSQKNNLSVEVEVEGQDGGEKEITCTAQGDCSSGNAGSEETTPHFSPFINSLFVFVLLGIFLFVFYGEVAVKRPRAREREAEKHWRERENVIMYLNPRIRIQIMCTKHALKI